jgi:RND family efflux transporter MFP subunit
MPWSAKAQAQVRASRQQLEAARLQLAYTRLSAPEQCTVARTYVEINQNVAPGQAVVRVNCGGCAEVAVSVPETEIARIMTGTEVAVTFNALGSGRLKGLVQEVGVASGQTATTFPVTVGLQERCDEVRSGMAADVEFSFPSQGPPGSVIVPYVSVGEDASGRFVFVLEPAGEDRLVARRRPVTVGDATPSGLTVLEGLADGELIATAGVHRLATGQEVTLLGEP